MVDLSLNGEVGLWEKDVRLHDLEVLKISNERQKRGEARGYFRYPASTERVLMRRRRLGVDLIGGNIEKIAESLEAEPLI